MIEFRVVIVYRENKGEQKKKKMQEYWYVFLNFFGFVKHHESW